MKSKIIIILTLIFLAINVIIYKVTQINQEQRIDSVLQSNLEKLKTHYEIQLYHQYITASAAYLSTIGNKEVINILKQVQTASKEQRAILRKQLYDILIPKYNILKQKGVLQYQFNLPDNRTFLRLHKPAKFNDDLTNIRYSYVYVNSFKKAISGLEQGKTTHGFRNVFPIFDENNNYLCAVEISYSSNLLQEVLNEVSKIHTHFIVNKKVIDVKAWKRDDFVSTYQPSKENKKFMMTKIKNRDNYEGDEKFTEILADKQKFISTKMDDNKAFNIYDVDNHTGYIISFYPIANIKEKKVVAWLVSYEIDKFIKDTIDNSTYTRILALVLLSVLFFFIYRTLQQKKISDRKVYEKTKELKEINENLEQRIIMEVDKNKKTQMQLFKSEKLAAMGDMIGNIAHQWRQPLSVISTSATGLILKKEFDQVTDEDLVQNCKLIDENAQYLSKTIDDFRNFIKGDREQSNFNLSENIDSFLHLVEPSTKNHNIKVIKNVDKDITLNGYPNELIQCFINIYNNSRDALKVSDVEQRYVFITVKKQKENVIIKFKDNAGGIPEDIIAKVFEPYFTTKHKSQGTGLGLHMTYNLIVNGMNGNLEVRNKHYSFDNKDYHGASFIITIPN